MRATPDIGAVAESPDWERGVLESLYEVAFSATDREIAGVLVGVPAPAGSPSSVQAVIPASHGHTPGQAAMFSHETWAYVHQAMGRHYRGLEVVGWYVSRPGQGTALLEADLLNHQRWFTRADQILLVLDSRAYRGSLYAWANGGLRQVHEGPVARRYVRPGREGPPVAALCFLVVLGILLGAIAFLLVHSIT